MRFAFIAAEKACFPVALMCRILAVSRAGFYAWRRRPPARRTCQDRTLAVAVAAIYAVTIRIAVASTRAGITSSCSLSTGCAAA